MKTSVALLVCTVLVSTHAQNCQLIVPNNPLTAQGLMTPYKLQNIPGDAGATPCDEANNGVAAFVQGAIIDLNTGAISIYNPLVVNAANPKPAINPAPVTLPANSVVALWFGFNGNILQLVGSTATTLAQANCVNGFAGTFFGEFSYCNAPAFFAAANNAILNGSLVVPPLGTAKDGQPCTTVRDFAVIDQDPSDNVLTDYLMVPDPKNAGQMLFAQNTAANRAQLANAALQTNASDNRLVALLIDAALGCTPWKAPDMADPGSSVAALPLNELLAAYRQPFPQALIPENDPMVQLNGASSVDKINLYRAGVNQPAIADPQRDANGLDFCQKFAAASNTRFNANKAALQAAPSPDPANTANLFDFLVNTRLAASFQGNGGLNCIGLGVANPFVTAAVAPGTLGGIAANTNMTLILILGVTGGALVLVGVGAAIFIFVQKRNAASTAANNFMAL